MNFSVFQIGMLLLYFHRLITARKHVTDDFYAVHGENISFICQLSNTRSSFTLSWRLNRVLILLHDPLIHGGYVSTGSFSSIISNNGTNLELLVSNVQFGDAGLYSCTKDFRSSGLPVSWFWNLNVQDVPKITIKKSVFIEKAAVLAECCVEFSLTWTGRNITWLINGDFSTAITTSLPRTSSSGKSERVCSTVTFQSSRLHNGKYLQCLAENKLNLSSSTLMTVNYPSKVKLLSSKYFIVKINSTINITCAAEGYPVPSVGLQFNVNGDIWYNVPLKAEVLSSTEATLTSSFLFAFTRSTGSVFRCKAFNTIGSTAVSKEVTIDVYSPAEVEMISESPIVIDNGYILLECRTSGVPSPEIHLQHALTSRTWVTLPLQPLHERGTLAWIFNVSQEYLADGSRYRCTANNTLDDVTISSSVTVQVRLTSKDFITDQLEVFVTLVIVIVFIFTTGCCVRYCQVIVSRQQGRTITEGKYNDSEEIPRLPTLRGDRRFFSMPRLFSNAARDQSLDPNLDKRTPELTAEFSYETIPTQATVETRPGTYEVSFAAFEERNVEGLGYSRVILPCDNKSSAYQL